MSNDANEANEDLIEATIRRVQEAKAARAAHPVDDQPVSREGIEPGDTRGSRSARADLHIVNDADTSAPDEAEDPIEATIRRVAEAKAARRDEPAPDQEDPIEATIRRVAEAKASRADEPASDDEDPIEATIRRVAEQQAARDSDAPAAHNQEPAEDPAAVLTSAIAAAENAPLAQIDDAGAEDPIEATIRRVAEQKAAREVEPPAAAAAAEEEDPIERTIRRVAEQKAARASEVSSDDNEPPREIAPAAQRREAPRPFVARDPVFEPAQAPAARQQFDRAPSSWEEATQQLQQGLAQTNQELRALAARFDALLPLLERVASTSTEVPSFSRQSAPRPAPSRGEDNWDDAPQLPQIQFGSPPRPAIMRDPSPQTATAQQLVDEDDEPDEVEIRPAPELTPAEEAHAEAKRGFALLPRTYRITVEDKRRGVDLVPLHRALLGMDGMRDMSLLSYSNGVAIISLETTGVIDPDVLCAAVSRAMSREAKVEVHNEQTMVVKLQEE